MDAPTCANCKHHVYDSTQAHQMQCVRFERSIPCVAARANPEQCNRGAKWEAAGQ